MGLDCRVVFYENITVSGYLYWMSFSTATETVVSQGSPELPQTVEAKFFLASTMKTDALRRIHQSGVSPSVLTVWVSELGELLRSCGLQIRWAVLYPPYFVPFCSPYRKKQFM